MAGMSDYLEALVLNHIFKAGAFASPTVYVSLHTADPTDAGTGTEVSGGSYARVATATSDWASAVVSGNGYITTNAGVITFPSPTATWGTVTYFGLWDAASAGHLLYSGALTTPRLIQNGDVAPTVAIGAIVVGQDVL